MEKTSLKEWFIHYKKNRDIMFRKIESITDEKDNIIIKNKDGSEEIGIVSENINSFMEILEKYQKDQNIIITVLNKKNHLNQLIKEWESIVKYPSLTLLFVNQDSMSEIKWLIKPAVHNSITEKPALKQGILSIAESVDLC